MASAEPTNLRVLVADERNQFLEPIASAVSDLGHQVIAREVDTSKVAGVTAKLCPDIAIVALHDDTEHALELITHITDEASCPVMALVEDARPEFVAEAADRGIFAYLDSAEESELRGGIDVAFQRFKEYKRLQDAFDRRSRIERAKGMLMERHGAEEAKAFDMIRSEARSSRRKLMDVIDEVLAGDS